MNIKYIMMYAIIATAVIAASTGGIVVAQNQGTLMISAVMFSKNPILIEEEQVITVTVIDARTNEMVSEATVSITVNGPGIEYTYTDTTNESGLISYTIPLEEESSPGDYYTSIQTRKEGYTPISENTHFVVLPS
jgi:uncharacterized protein YfaS (alpha-2-macroglobulin family)